MDKPRQPQVIRPWEPSKHKKTKTNGAYRARQNRAESARESYSALSVADCPSAFPTRR